MSTEANYNQIIQIMKTNTVLNQLVAHKLRVHFQQHYTRPDIDYFKLWEAN